MKNFSNSFIGFICIIICTFFSCSQSEDKTEPQKIVEEEIDIETTLTQGMVTFLSGDVYIAEGDDWQYLDVGDYVTTEDTIDVETDSYCELQFGDTAVIRLEANSKIFLKDLVLTTEQTNIAMQLDTGSVLCKVDNLSSNDSFTVKTRTATCGVRGTEFGVKITEDSDTVLAVKQGKVAVLPSNVDIDEVKKKVSEKSEDLVELVSIIEETATIVEADQEITVDEKAVADTEVAFNILEEKVDKIVSKEEITQEDIKDIEQTVNQTKVTIDEVIEPPQKVSQENKKELEKIDKMKKVEIVPVTTIKTEEKEEVKEQEKIKLIKISLNTNPAEANILLNQERMGSGKFSGLFIPGEKLSFTIEKEGYESETLEIVVEKSGKTAYQIKLKEIPQDKTPTEITPPVEETVVEPPIIEEPKPILFTSTIAKNPFIRDMIISGTNIYLADNQGSLYAINKQGKKIWQHDTNNKPNHNSAPVIIDNKVYFSGTLDLVVLNIRNGSLLNKMKLDDSSRHMFGQKIVYFDNKKALLPTDKGFRVIDFNSMATIRDIVIPDGTQMSPAVYNGKAYLVNQVGKIYSVNVNSGMVEEFTEASSASQPLALPMAIYDGKGYFSGRKGTIVGVDLNKKTIMWQSKLDPDKKIFPKHDIECGKSGIYIYTEETIWAFNLEQGQTVFDKISAVSSPPLYHDGKLYYGTTNGYFKIINASTGKAVKELKIGEKIVVRPRIINDNVAVATQKGKVLIINPEAF